MHNSARTIPRYIPLASLRPASDSANRIGLLVLAPLELYAAIYVYRVIVRSLGSVLAHFGNARRERV